MKEKLMVYVVPRLLPDYCRESIDRENMQNGRLIGAACTVLGLIMMAASLLSDGTAAALPDDVKNLWIMSHRLAWLLLTIAAGQLTFFSTRY